MNIASLDIHQSANQIVHHGAHIEHAANNVHTLPYKQNQLKYMHQMFFNPPIPTLIDAIKNGQLEGIPCMKADLVRKYLAPSPATPKGRMKGPRAGIRSTWTKKHESRRSRDLNQDPSSTQTEQQNLANTNANVIPSNETHEVNNVFCFAALADKQTGTLYTYATGALPVNSLDGYQYYFVAYDYDTNYIFAIPIKDITDATIITAFDGIFTMLTEKGTSQPSMLQTTF